MIPIAAELFAVVAGHEDDAIHILVYCKLGTLISLVLSLVLYFDFTFP